MACPPPRRVTRAAGLHQLLPQRSKDPARTKPPAPSLIPPWRPALAWRGYRTWEGRRNGSSARHPPMPCSRPMRPHGPTACPGASFHWLVIAALGITWIKDSLEARWSAPSPAPLPTNAPSTPSSTQIGPAASSYPRRCGHRRAVLRPPHRFSRTQETVHGHGARLPGGDDPDRLLLGFLVVRRVPLLHQVRASAANTPRSTPRSRS